jgi:hypothetical protein
MPVNDESAASIANGEVIGCGGNANTSRIGTHCGFGGLQSSSLPQAVLQAAVGNGLSFDPLSFCQNIRRPHSRSASVSTSLKTHS